MTSQSIQQQHLNSQNERENCRNAGIAWPPRLWQRVEIFGNRFASDPPGPVLGTIVSMRGTNYGVVPDGIEADNPYPRECYWEELRPVLDDTAPGWVPLRFWKSHLHDPMRPGALDLKLTSGRRAFNCWPRVRPPRFFCFLELDMPYRQYTEHEIAAVRPAQS